MALAFDKYGRVVKPGEKTSEIDALEAQRKQAQKEGRYADVTDIYLRMQKLKAAADKLKAAADPNSPERKAEDAWNKAMDLYQRPGPFTDAVQQQMINRRADQSAAAEAADVEEIRNLAAARGLDPTQAIRQAQQQRQAQNLAFSGDLRSQAAIQNFAAESPGRMAAAQANLMRQFGGGRQSAVQGGSAPSLAFPMSSGPSGGSSSGSIIPRIVQSPTAGQSAPNRVFGMPTSPQPQPQPPRPAPQPAPQPQPAPVLTMNPTQRQGLLNSLNGKTVGPHATQDQAAIAYQNIYKYL